MADTDMFVARSGRDADEAALFAEPLRFRLAILTRFSKEACGLTFGSSILTRCRNRCSYLDYAITCHAWRAEACPCDCACVSITFYLAFLQ